MSDDRRDDQPMIENCTFTDCGMVLPPGNYAIPGAIDVASWPAFVAAARKLKSAESAVLEARAEYAEAVKKLSEEAVR